MKRSHPLFAGWALAVGVFAAGCSRTSTHATQASATQQPTQAHPATLAEPPTGTTAAPSASTITLDEFSSINEDMTVDQVTATVGSPGAVTAHVNSDDIETRTWNGRPGTNGFAMVVFRDGIVYGKTQDGLS
jgi:hypothetical protein